MQNLIEMAYREKVDLSRPARVAKFLARQTGRKIDTFGADVREFIDAAGPEYQNREAARVGGLFRAATRWANDNSKTLEKCILMAAPMAQSNMDDELGATFWTAHPAFNNGFTIAYGSAGPHDTEEQAMARARASMLADGWRETREEAEADLAAALAARDKANRLTVDELRAAGEALYGDRWQSDLSRDLGLNDPVRIRQWLSGARPIPIGIRSEVVRLLRQHADAANAVADRLNT